MKRIFSIVLVMMISLIMSITAFGQKGEQTTIRVDDGISHKVQDVHAVNLLMGGKDVYTDVPSVLYTIQGKSRTLVPIRFVVEELGANIDWNQEKQEATIKTDNKEIILKIDSSIAYVNGRKVNLPDGVPAKLLGYQDKYRTMVPLRFVVEQLGMDVNWIGETMTATVDLPKQAVKDIWFEQVGATPYVMIKTTGEVNVRPMYLEGSKYGSKDKLVIDIPNTELDIQDPNFEDRNGVSTKTIGFNGISEIRTSLFETKPRAVTRIVVDLEIPRGYQIFYDKENHGIKIEFTNTVRDVGVKKINGMDAIAIHTDEMPAFNTINLGNRMVVDILNAKLKYPQSEIDLNKMGVKKIRMAQFEPDMNYDKDDKIVRVVLDLEEGQTADNVFVTYEENDVVIYVNNKLLDSFDYRKEGADQSVLQLSLQDQGKYEADYANKKLRLSVLKSEVELDEAVLDMDDNVVQRIVIDDSNSKYYYIDVYLADGTTYTIEKQSGVTNNIVVNFENKIMSESKYKGKLVVLDAGHGGKDPGAHTPRSKINEKALALDTVVRLNKLLEEEGFTTYLTRKDDTFIGLYERSRMANELNADAFVSVHYNAHSDKNISGVQVLYNGDDPSRDNKNFATIVQNSLINKLNAVDRKIVHRPNLVVIRETKMPAILAEMAFLSNPNEEALAATESYRQKCAEALLDGIKRYFDQKL
ncbi:N-acetylmuramoyl-L-alanine amidase [Lutibacter sp. B2]|nr:N-acetylmuramoyl-L-alanine amidase [Lutibacter sp. B2]